MAFYNYRVTGSQVVFPYEANEKLYAVAPAFLMLPLRPVPHYNHEVLRTFWSQTDVEFYHWMRSDVWNASRLKFLVLWRTFIGEWPIAVPLALAPLLVCSRRAKFPLFVLTFFICGLLLQKGTLPHYAAPITGLVCMTMVLGLHRMYLWKPDGQATGKIFANVILVSFAFFFVSKAIRISSFEFTPGTKFKAARRSLVRQLEETPGDHLVLIRYMPDHDIRDEWVYNRADIDASKIVWARDMGIEQNRRLLQYYSNRKVWVLEPDLPDAKLTAQKIICTNNEQQDAGGKMLTNLE
jgi:hypothetical protein